MTINSSNFVDQLLKQRMYSLLFEGGHRWIDARRYNRLNQLPLDQTTHFIHTWLPIPQTEMNARGG
jgi:hypothetical protein